MCNSLPNYLLLEYLLQTGKLVHEDLDQRALDALKEFPVEGALAVLKQFLEANLVSYFFKGGHREAMGFLVITDGGTDKIICKGSVTLFYNVNELYKSATVARLRICLLFF